MNLVNKIKSCNIKGLLTAVGFASCAYFNLGCYTNIDPEWERERAKIDQEYSKWDEHKLDAIVALNRKHGYPDEFSQTALGKSYLERKTYEEAKKQEREVKKREWDREHSKDLIMDEISALTLRREQENYILTERDIAVTRAFEWFSKYVSLSLLYTFNSVPEHARQMHKYNVDKGLPEDLGLYLGRGPFGIPEWKLKDNLDEKEILEVFLKLEGKK